MTLIPVGANHDRRFGGLVRLYGARAAQRIFNSHVIVIGVGGVGSWSAEALARSGVARITMIDMDHISESNINRQIHSLESTLGKAKIEVMRDRLTDINPDCQIHLIDNFVTPENWNDLLQKSQYFSPVMGVLDACDQVATKSALAAWSLRHKELPFITVGAAGGKQQAQCVQIGDLSIASHDPLLAKLRYNLRRQNGAARKGQLGLTCVYSPEPVKQPIQPLNSDACEIKSSVDGSLNCHGFGSSVSVTATFGLCAAGWLMSAFAKQCETSL